jgi:hypothetical protein
MMFALALLLTLSAASAWQLNLPTLSTLPKNKWLNKAAVAVVALQLSTPLLLPAPALADPIPLVGASAPDFKLPSNRGKGMYGM